MIPVVPPKKEPNAELRAQGSKIIDSIEKKVEEIRQNGLNIGQTALWVGGIAFASYLLIDLLTGKSKKTKVKLRTTDIPIKAKTKDSWIVSSIKGYILAFVLGIVKEKIVDALKELEKAEQKPNEN